MKIVIKKTNVITNSSDWVYYAPPKDLKRQWKPGRSAMLLAEFATSKKFPLILKKWISKYNLSNMKVNSIDVICEPEAQTSLFDNNRNLGRNHDLLIKSKDFVIGIEAKVSEPFGEEVGKEYEDAVKKNNDPSTKKKSTIPQRIKSIMNTLGLEKQFSNKDSKVYSLKYQLLTGLVGTILAAKEAKTTKCLFLIVNFTGDVDDKTKKDKKNEEQNREDYKIFSDIVFHTDNGGIFKADKETIKYSEDITCIVDKIEVKVTNKSFDI